MRTRTSPRGLRVTELGLGAAQLGNLGRITTDDEAAGAVAAAWDAGIRYFDTAPHYGLGLSERRLGALLAERPRDEFVVSTKVGRLLEPDPDHRGGVDEGFVVPTDLRRVWDFSRDGVLRSIEQSLTRLGMDRVEIVYLHDPHDHFAQASTEAAQALVELRDQGVIDGFGVGINDTRMMVEFVRRCDVDILMVAGRHTLLDHDASEELLPLAAERGVAVVAAAVYNSGLLGNPRVLPGATYDYAPAPAELIARANTIAEICERHGVTLPAAAMVYPLRHPAVVSVVVGARTAGQVLSNVERAATAVPDALWEELVAAGHLPADDR